MSEPVTVCPAQTAVSVALIPLASEPLATPMLVRLPPVAAVCEVMIPLGPPQVGLAVGLPRPDWIMPVTPS